MLRRKYSQTHHCSQDIERSGNIEKNVPPHPPNNTTLYRGDNTRNCNWIVQQTLEGALKACCLCIRDEITLSSLLVSAGNFWWWNRLARRRGHSYLPASEAKQLGHLPCFRVNHRRKETKNIRSSYSPLFRENQTKGKEKYLSSSKLPDLSSLLLFCSNSTRQFVTRHYLTYFFEILITTIRIKKYN